MVSGLAKPQRGQVSTDSRTMALIVTSLLHCGGVSRVRGRLSQCLGLGLIGIVGDGRRLLVEIDLDVTHAGHLLQRLLDRDRTESARHVLHVERDGFRGSRQRHCGFR